MMLLHTDMKNDMLMRWFQESSLFPQFLSRNVLAYSIINGYFGFFLYILILFFWGDQNKKQILGIRETIWWADHKYMMLLKLSAVGVNTGTM